MKRSVAPRVQPLTGTWTLWGQIQGETHGVGLWVTIQGVSNPEGKRIQIADPMTALIRWEWIIGASLSVEPPEHKRIIGF